jgi:hypothetical protein
VRVTANPTTRRWVATSESARQAAGAFLGLTVRQKRIWVIVALAELVLACLLALSFADDTSWVARVVWGPVYALVPTLVLAATGLGLAHVLNVRRFRRRIPEGVVLEAAIGEQALVLRGPWAEYNLAFDGLESVRSDGRWVFVRQIGSPVFGVWPAERFAAPDLERVMKALPARTR